MLALTCVSLTAASGQQVSNERTLAQLNSLHILHYLDSLDLANVANGIPAIENKTLVRPAPTYPVWIAEMVNDKILFYEGKPEFRGESVAKLIDDAGSRFGLAALNKAKSYKPGWQFIKLGGNTYQMYCGHRSPFLVCTVIPVLAGDLK